MPEMPELGSHQPKVLAEAKHISLNDRSRSWERRGALGTASSQEEAYTVLHI